MSYQVLARKWRPRAFRELVGQEHVVRALVNALDNDRLHHAFLFTGTRGVGKTTISRVFAKSLNCERGVSSNPCGVCTACGEIDEGRFVDLIEVDAASRTKVEDTRELLENVQYAPTHGRYKVYLIDEVHMLSTHSFNALLKTLEEPPPHVKFLLATTDPQRLPVTILSRCLQFNLKRLPTAVIAEHLSMILEEEGVQQEETAVALIAQAGDGSMRDALSLLDQAIAFSGGRVTLDDVRDMLGTIDQGYLFRLLGALAEGNAEGVLTCVAELDQRVPDYAAVLAELISLLQRIAVVQAVPGVLHENSSDPDELQRLASSLSPEDVQLFYQIALLGRRDLPLSPDPRGGLEMVLLRMLCFRPVQAERLLEGSGSETAIATSQPTPPRQTTSAVTAPAPSQVHESPVPQTLSTRVEPATDWSTIVTQLGLTGIARQLALNCVLKNCVLKGREDNSVHLLLDPCHAQTRTKNGEERLKTALERYFGKPLRLHIEVSQPDTVTPARQQSQRQVERQKIAEETIHQDPNVQALRETFNAQIKPDSIVPRD